MSKAKAEPPGTTHVRMHVEGEDDFVGLNVVRVSLGVFENEPAWLCLRSDGGYSVDVGGKPWNDEWEPLA